MLKGKHVILRAIEREDLPLLVKFNNDLAVELASGGDPPLPQSLAQLQAEYEQKANNGGRDSLDRGSISFAIEADGKFIGQCGLFRYNSSSRVCELGITIGDKDYWGRGYGREAVSLLVDYGFRYHNLRRMMLHVHASNERAIKAYLACGFVEEGRLREHVWSTGRYEDMVLMGILRGNDSY
jgi:RimJ/RimL family protein N-acetyltransferase